MHCIGVEGHGVEQLKPGRSNCSQLMVVDGVVQRHWFPDIGKSFPDIGNSVDFPISGNHFPISENHFSISENGFNFSILGIISWYREIQFPLSENDYVFPDIGNLNCRYREMIFRYRELFPDIGNSNSRYREIISDISNWWIKTQMAFHTPANISCIHGVIQRFIMLHQNNTLCMS